MSEEDGNIQGVMIDEVIDSTALPNGSIALIVRNAGSPVGLVFDAEGARQASELLADPGDSGDNA